MEQLGQATPVQDRAHGEEVGTAGFPAGPGLRSRGWGGQVVVGAKGDVEDSVGTVGEAARDLAPRKLRAGEDGAGGANARGHEHPPTKTVEGTEVLGLGEEREVVHRGHPGEVEREGTGVGG
jgi:hypothetical protein